MRRAKHFNCSVTLYYSISFIIVAGMLVPQWQATRGVLDLQRIIKHVHYIKKNNYFEPLISTVFKVCVTKLKEKLKKLILEK